jgi:hypothetical protein
MMADRRRTTEARIKPVRTVIYRLIWIRFVLDRQNRASDINVG